MEKNKRIRFSLSTLIWMLTIIIILISVFCIYKLYIEKINVNETVLMQNEQIKELKNSIEILQNQLDNDLNVTDNNENLKEDNESSIIKEVSPSGFSGSSNHVLKLYSNGDVYMFNYDGTGFDEEALVSKELIATNATSIDNNDSGEVIVDGKNEMKSNYMWIVFENVAASQEKYNISYLYKK